MSYVVVTLQNNSHRAGHAYSEHHSIVDSDIFCLDFAVASPNKKIIRIWRIGGVLVVSKNMKTIELSLTNVPSAKQY